MMLVRKAKKEDIDSIHGLDKESVEYHMRFDGDFYDISQEWWSFKRDSQLKALKNPKNLIVVAEENKRTIGYAWGYVEKLTKFNIGKVQEIIVTKEHRSRGVATALLNEMFEFFRKNKCIISEVWVNVENQPALKAFEKFGFEKKDYRMISKLDKTKKFRPFS